MSLNYYTEILLKLKSPNKVSVLVSSEGEQVLKFKTQWLCFSCFFLGCKEAESRYLSLKGKGQRETDRSN